MTIALQLQQPDLGRWYAELDLTFSLKSHLDKRTTCLSRVKRKGPLSIQKPFYPEGSEILHLYLLHPPAGIVSGDQLTFKIQAQESSHALLTTPGANRFYKARQAVDKNDMRSERTNQQRQITELTLATHSIIENLPQETLIYDGANALNQVDIRLDKNSTYIGWDINCLGLPAANKPFTNGQFRQINRVYIDDNLSYHDAVFISDTNKLFTARAGLYHSATFATLIAYSPAFFNQYTEAEQAQSNQSSRKNKQINPDIVTEIRTQLSHMEVEQLFSLTLIDGLLVCRYLGQQSELCKKVFTQIWLLLRPYYGINSTSLPRIWYT